MIIFPLISGTLSSLLHVISGPDHLAAVTPLAIESKRKAWKIGLFWGVGHLAGMLLIGVLFLFFKNYIPVETISEHSEQLVAYVLIGVGAWALFRLFKDPKKHNHPHVHTEEGVFIHTHNHSHSDETKEHTHKTQVKQSLISAFGIGFLHGLAGVAHFLLLLPALGFESQLESVTYIIGFAIGTIIAMTVYALVLDKIVSVTKQQNNELFFKGIRFAGGLFAVIIGFYWLYLTF